VDATLGRLDGVKAVDANPVAQTATVTYDPAVTSVAQLRAWVEQCGYHCAGQSVPGHVCDPMEEPAVDGRAVAHEGHEAHPGDEGHGPHATEEGPARARPTT